MGSVESTLKPKIIREIIKETPNKNFDDTLHKLSFGLIAIYMSAPKTDYLIIKKGLGTIGIFDYKQFRKMDILETDPCKNSLRPIHPS